MSNHKQANLFIDTHELLEEIIKQKKANKQRMGLSKAAVLHELVVEMHSKMSPLNKEA